MNVVEKRNKAIEKLKEEFEKSNSNIEKVIINYCLLPEVRNNDEFLDRVLDEKKSVSKMFTKISSWIRKSNNLAPSHDVVFSLAIHYYQEEKPEYVVEMMEEEELKFGDASKELKKPIIKHITGTVIKETIKEVAKAEKKKSSKKKSSKKKDIRKKVEKQVKKELENMDQLSLFDLDEDN